MTKLVANNLFKVYDNGTTALRGLSFELSDGDFVNVMGSSGCGKTTLLKCIAGVEGLSSGELYCDGELLNNVDVQQRNVALVSQEFSLFPNMTVFENVLFALKKHRATYDEKCAVVWDILHKTRLDEIQNAFPRELSYGQRQKTAIARALVKQPRIILFDEPLSNLDPIGKATYRALIGETKRAFPSALYLYVTHNGADAMALGNKTLLMDGGKALQFGDTDDVFANPCCLTAAQICREQCNARQGVVGDSCVTTDDGDESISPYMQATLRVPVGSTVTVVGNGNRTGLFDLQGNAVCGCMQSVALPCNVGRNDVTIDGKSFPLGELSDGVVCTGNGFAVCPTDKIVADFDIGGTLSDDRISVVSTVGYIDDKHIVCNCLERKITIRMQNFAQNCTNLPTLGAQLRLSVSLADVRFVTDDGNVAVADYRVYPNFAVAKVADGKHNIVVVGGIRITLPFSVTGKTVQLQFAPNCFAVTDDKRQLAVKRVLNVQIGTSQTIFFAEIHGFCRYVTAILPNYTPSAKQLYLRPDPKGITLV